jgi:hypothetical protein
MIYNVSYGPINDRTSEFDFLGERNFNTIIDVGAAYNPWAGSHVTHTVDINETSSTYHQFKGNICEETVWGDVLEYCESKHSKFDFAICTHTLEDILNPFFVAKKLSMIAKEGFVAMPSKWVDLSRSSHRPFKGWMHHRWVFDVIDGVLVCVPKLSYMEYLNTDEFIGKPEEIKFYWKDELPVKILNDDFIGPDEQSYLELVQNFLNH